ncbi:MAG: hypothetical protein ABW022_20530 [Actinoplanes sp.]
MAWPESALPPPDSEGQESEEPEFVEPEPAEPESVLVLVDESVSEAYAATPTAIVPATLAATKAPVSSAVRRSPVSRIIGRSIH